jgi:hypothetical protein
MSRTQTPTGAPPARIRAGMLTLRRGARATMPATNATRSPLLGPTQPTSWRSPTKIALPRDHPHTPAPPYRRQRTAAPARTMAQLRSPTPGSTQLAAVLLPLPLRTTGTAG